jgi:glucan phosphoethanolaminetransferase (alkaline phosphatase superfamily)
MNIIKKKFSVFFYGLPIVWIGSCIGLFYTLSLINTTFQEMVFQINAPWYKEHQLKQLEIQLYNFLSIYFCCILTHLVISLYVIQYADTPIDSAWKPFMRGVKIAITVLTGTAGVVIAAEAPVAPNRFSHYIHTSEWTTWIGIGRGYDAEIGDIHGKLAATKLQNLVGREKFLAAVKECSENRILDSDTLQTIMDKPEIKKIINEKATFMDRRILNFTNH